MTTRNVVHALALSLCTLAFPAASFASHWDVGISVGFAPPPLPVYAQPPCPAPGYIWTPGYWAYTDDAEDYYWVPGTWVYAPAPGLLWTPGYWAENDGEDYEWHGGYWAPHVGFYGGINYGFGYFGVGFDGGYWRDRDFYYNRAVANVVNVNVTNVYSTTVINRFGDERTSYNGRDGVQARPRGSELQARLEPHRGWTPEQQSHIIRASTLPDLRAASNHGRPPVAATARPGIYEGRGVVAARAAPLASLNPSRDFSTDSSRGFHASAPANGGRQERPNVGAGDHYRAPPLGQTPQHNDRPAWAAPRRAEADPSRRMVARAQSAPPAPLASSNPGGSFTYDDRRGFHSATPVDRAHYNRPNFRAGADYRAPSTGQIPQRNDRPAWAAPVPPDADRSRRMVASVQSAPPTQLHRDLQPYGRIDHASPPPMQRSAAPWAAPNRDQRSWRPEPVPLSRPYTPPPATPHWAEQRSPQAFSAASPRMEPHPMQAPARMGSVESRRDGRER